MTDIITVMKYLENVEELKRRQQEGEPLLTMIMPNGKQLGHCTGPELRRMGETMNKVGDFLADLKGQERPVR